MEKNRIICEKKLLDETANCDCIDCKSTSPTSQPTEQGIRETLKEELRIALRYPQNADVYATDMDSRGSLDRAVDLFQTRFNLILQDLLDNWVGEVDKDYNKDEELYDVGQSVDYGINNERQRVRYLIAKAKI